MHLVQTLQEIEDARTKGLLSETEASTQKAAVLERHRSHTPMAWTSWPHRHGCCSPNRRSRFVHGWVAFWALMAVVISACTMHAFKGEVWISCSNLGDSASNTTHPYFCDADYDRYDYDEDDCEDHSRYNCGNERFEFDWKTIKYSTLNTTTKLTWDEIISKGVDQVFTESIGNFNGNNYIFTQTKKALHSLKTVLHILQAAALLGLIAIIMAIRRTFYRNSRVETTKRWMFVSAPYIIMIGLGIAAFIIGARLAMIRNDDHDHEHGRRHGHHHDWHATEWTSHYPSEYNCVATPKFAAAGIAAGIMYSVVFVLLAAWLRACCLRCRNRDLDEAQARWQVARTMMGVQYSHATQISAAGGTPPPYVTMSAEDEKKLIGSTSVA